MAHQGSHLSWCNDSCDQLQQLQLFLPLRVVFHGVCQSLKYSARCLIHKQLSMQTNSRQRYACHAPLSTPSVNTQRQDMKELTVKDWRA